MAVLLSGRRGGGGGGGGSLPSGGTTGQVLTKESNADGDVGWEAGGGSSPLLQSADVTTDPDTFEVFHVFDLAGIASAQVLFDITALDGDGETFGNDNPGELAVYFSSSRSLDGVTYSGYAGWNDFITGQAQTESDVLLGLGVTVRYLRIRVFIGMGEADPDAGNEYAGANNPTAAVTLNLTYR